MADWYQLFVRSDITSQPAKLVVGLIKYLLSLMSTVENISQTKVLNVTWLY